MDESGNTESHQAEKEAVEEGEIRKRYGRRQGSGEGGEEHDKESKRKFEKKLVEGNDGNKWPFFTYG